MPTSTTTKLAMVLVRCLCACVLAISLASIAQAQATLPSGTRAYPVRHRDAADLATQLRAMLASPSSNSQVFVDQELNRLIVQGSAKEQQIASELIGSLDLPSTTATNAQPATIARAYPTAGRDPNQLAQALQKQFPTARIAADARTGQVVVLAPEASQRQIATALGAPLQRPAAAPEQQPARRVAGYQLQNTTWREFEAQLREMWGQRLAVSTTPSGEVATIILASSTGPQTAMQIDRRTNVVTFGAGGPGPRAWEQVARAIDIPRGTTEDTQLISVRDADPTKVRRAVALVQATVPVTEAIDSDENTTATIQLGGANRARWGGDLVANMFQPGAQGAPAGQGQAAGAAPGQVVDVPADPEGSGLIGPVQIEFLEGMDAIMIRGHKRDVERVRKIIEDIERLSKETQPLVEVYPLEFVNSEAVTTLVTELYEEILSPRQGQVSLRALVEPNAILMIGREESVTVVKDLVEKLDRPTSPASRFEVIRLQHVSALDAETAVRNFFVNRPGTDTELRSGLGTRVQVIADYRTNTLIVQASPRDLGEVKRLIETIDTEDPASTAQVRVFKLKNAMAEDLAEVLTAAIAGDEQQQAQQGGQGGQTQAGSRLPSTALEFMMLDQAGGRLLRSGVVSDVQVSADANTNALIVRAPAKSMELIEALIKELDQMPDAEAKLKVFTIVNGDATSLAATLQQVFGQDVTIGQGTGGALGIAFRQPQVQQTTTGTESSLIPLTFAVDIRTNSVIVSGSGSDLEVVETLLLRLDEEGFTTRQIMVYRLKNNDAQSVADAITSYVQGQQATLTQTVANGGVSTTLDQLLLQISVIPESISNSVIVASSPRYMESIMETIRDLDVRPPMVMVQVLIAEINLTAIHEFGAEFGLQDDLLFDRSLGATNIGDPGFNFNEVGLPNFANFARGTIGTQSLADLGLGRNGFFGGGTTPGGLVLSAASDSVNLLIRALEEEGHAQVLSRPQVMALNNQPAFVQVGQDVARYNGSTATNTGVTQDVVDVPTGLILSITPRINDDGVVVMTVDTDKSALGAGGTELSDGAGGTFTVPPIDRTTAQTTISAKSGQTVVIGGLITKRDDLTSRGVPYLRDLPWVGPVFNFEAKRTLRTELLIVLTPYIVAEDEDYEFIKSIESQRMSWCLGDVVMIDGERGLQGGGCFLCDNSVPTLFPDNDPTGTQFAESQHEHNHDAPQPTPIALPVDQAGYLQQQGYPQQGVERQDLQQHGLRRQAIGQQPNLQPLPQQPINAGYDQYGQPVNRAAANATTAEYFPPQRRRILGPADQPRTNPAPSWFPFGTR